MENPFRLAAPRFAGIVLSIQRLDNETQPRPDVPFRHGHHEDGRLATDPRRLLTLVFWGKGELEMLHQGRDDNKHFQDATQQK